MTARKKITGPLYGYEGQPAEYELKSGNTLPAGELVERAATAFHEAHPGLDASQVGMAWNNLEEGERYRYCLEVLDAANAASEATGQAADTANVLDTVGATAAKHLGAALIDAALTEVKALARPWQQMTEDQQDDVLERITSQVRDAVGETIRMLATRGAAHVVCELEQITVKKDAKAVLSIPRAGIGDDLLDAVGLSVILVVGPELAEARDIPKPKPDPDQADLLGQAHLGSGVGGDGGPDGAQDPGTVQHSDPEG